MDLKPVIWISSVDHLKSYDEIIKNNRPPSTYFSSGEVTFRANELSYHSIEIADTLFNKFILLRKQHNLKELSFVLKPSNIKSIKWYGYKYPNKFGTWKCIRILCNEEVMGGDFLISADGFNNTMNLFEMLNQFKDGLEVTTSLKDLSNSKMILVSYSSVVLFLLLFSQFSIPFIERFNLDILFLILFLILGLILIISFIWYLINLRQSSKLRNQFINIFFHYLDDFFAL
jgi:hypothetical protein